MALETYLSWVHWDDNPRQNTHWKYKLNFPLFWLLQVTREDYIMCVANVCLYTRMFGEVGRRRNIIHSLWIMHGFTLDNTISILLQWAVFSVLCIKSGCGDQPMVICKALSTPVRDEESAATGSPLAAIISQRSKWVSSLESGEVWTLSLTMWQQAAVGWTFSSELSPLSLLLFLHLSWMRRDAKRWGHITPPSSTDCDRLFCTASL